MHIDFPMLFFEQLELEMVSDPHSGELRVQSAHERGQSTGLAVAMAMGGSGGKSTQPSLTL